MKKIILLTLVLSLLCLYGCGEEKDQEQSTTESLSAIEPKSNFLTGKPTEVPEEKSPRPVAVTINNIEASLPQYGIGQADVIMEMPVEGGITRLLAIYSDYRKVPEVCSIRSCRYYFPIFAKGFDAVYFCYGSNELLGTPMLEKTGIDYIDGNKASDPLVFERDENRLETYSPEHTVYLKGSNMREIFMKYDFHTEISPSYKSSAFDFAETKKSLTSECTEITGSFSSSYSSGFFYDSENEVFLKTHNGEKHIDSATSKQLGFENVFLLYADVSTYQDTNLIEMNWHGGKGVYATMGTSEKITWKKASESSPIEFFDSDGKPLEINKGKSYIAVGVENIIFSRNSSAVEN